MPTPITTGWYAVRLPQPSGAPRLRAVFCFEQNDGALSCEHDGCFLAPSDARAFGVAEWHGPYARRSQAEEVLATLAPAEPRAPEPGHPER